MSLIGRYIFRQTATALLMILITLTLIVWLATAMRQLSLITNQGQGFWVFMQITTLAMPNLIAIVAPIALLIACLHTLNRLAGDSELIVLSAAGATIWRVLQPYLALAMLVVAFIIAVNAYILPQSTSLLRDYITQIRTDIISQVLQPGQFTEMDRGLTFHVRDRSPSGELLGLMLHDERDAKRIMTYLADRGRIFERDGRAFLVMYEGHIHRQQQDSREVNIVTFDSYLFDLSQLALTDRGKPENDLKPREMFLSELMFPDKTHPQYNKMKGKIRAELHERLANPLYPILFVLIAVLHLGSPRTTRDGRLESVVMAFVVAAGLRMIGLAATNLAAKQAWAVALIYGAPLIGIAGALLMMAFNIKPLSFPKLTLKLPRLRLLPQK